MNFQKISRIPLARWIVLCYDVFDGSKFSPDFRVGSSVGRAQDWKSWCRRFDPAPAHCCKIFLHFIKLIEALCLANEIVTSRSPRGTGRVKIEIGFVDSQRNRASRKRFFRNSDYWINWDYVANSSQYFFVISFFWTDVAIRTLKWILSNNRYFICHALRGVWFNTTKFCKLLCAHGKSWTTLFCHSDCNVNSLHSVLDLCLCKFSFGSSMFK